MLVNRSPFPFLVTSVCQLHKQLHQEKTLHCSFIRDTSLDDTSYSCEKIEENPRNMTTTRSKFTPAAVRAIFLFTAMLVLCLTAPIGPPVGILRDKSTLNLNFHGNGNFDSDFAAITLVIEELFSIQSCWSVNVFQQSYRTYGKQFLLAYSGTVCSKLSIYLVFQAQEVRGKA